MVFILDFFVVLYKKGKNHDIYNGHATNSQ